MVTWPRMLSKDVVLAVLYKVYLVKQVDTVQHSLRAWACVKYKHKTEVRDRQALVLFAKH